MTVQELLEESTLGGPGLRGYAYRADVYCPVCGEDICADLAPALAPTIGDARDIPTDTDTYPQPMFFAESDAAMHCGKCGEYLYGEEV